jgi:hypothetical protein
MRFNRFVFLNRPVLSLETHLGVTTSPQAPLPADFVTLSVFDKSPPLRLTLPRSRERSCYNPCIPNMLKRCFPLMRRGPTASRRTVREVSGSDRVHRRRRRFDAPGLGESRHLGVPASGVFRLFDGVPASCPQ